MKFTIITMIIIQTLGFVMGLYGLINTFGWLPTTLLLIAAGLNGAHLGAKAAEKNAQLHITHD